MSRDTEPAGSVGPHRPRARVQAAQRAAIRAVGKPWGAQSLHPWNGSVVAPGEPIGELWFDPAGGAPDQSDLLLKLLFTEQILSVQVHPDDDYARALGQPNGKSEAWYVLSARPGSRVAIGLITRLSQRELRAAALDGSIANLIAWREVVAGDVVNVPAGTIHAIGPGIVIAEIQQRSDATFRLFDFGRQRELHLDHALAIADAGPLPDQAPMIALDAIRTVLVASEPFVLERLHLPPFSRHRITVDREGWILAVAGSVGVDNVHLDIAEAAYLCATSTILTTGAGPCVVLFAYPGPSPSLDLVVGAELQENFP